MRVTCSAHFILGHLITLIFVISGFCREVKETVGSVFREGGTEMGLTVCPKMGLTVCPEMGLTVCPEM